MENDRPLVTIAIPTYNRADSTLPLTIESALNQDYPKIEIVISDNFSNDHTEQLIDRYKDHRIHYIRQKKNIGPNKNYNACLRAAKGDYFLLLHDDDLIDLDFVSTCLKQSNYQTAYGFIRTGVRMIDKSGSVIKEYENHVTKNTPEALYKAWLNGKTPFYLCSTLFNTIALKNIGGFHSKNNLFEDGIAIIKISKKWPLLNIAEIKASFRQHPEQRTHAAGVTKWCEDFKEAIELICNIVDTDKALLYRQGMEKFSKVGLNFARNLNHPVKKAIAVFNLNKIFPYKYWPKTSWKFRLIGITGSLFYPEKKPIFKN